MIVSFFEKFLSLLVATLLSQSLLAGELRIVSYNIKHCQGMDGKLDLDRTAEVLKKLDADVIALQEVDKNCARSGGVDQAAELGKKLGMHHFFGRAINLGKGEYGNAVLSKYPIEKSLVHKLPSKGEDRVVAEVQVKTELGLVSVCSIHLDHKSEEIRLGQLKAFGKFTAEYKQPIILTGDFNAKPGSETMEFVQKSWNLVAKKGDRKTNPADMPRSEIDYCVTRNINASSMESSVVDEPLASDHRPVLTIIKW